MRWRRSWACSCARRRRSPMIRTNLSTKPFYNERAIHSVLAFAGLVVIALTVFNLMQIVLLTRRQSDLNTRQAAAETQARELRSRASSVRQSVDPKQLEAISGAAREVNVLIEIGRASCRER